MIYIFLRRLEQRIASWTIAAAATLFGFTLSSTIIRIEHPEIGSAVFPGIICLLCAVLVTIRCKTNPYGF